MSYLTIILLIFSMLGALDRIAGNRLGLGKEFERAFMLNKLRNFLIENDLDYLLINTTDMRRQSGRCQEKAEKYF